ncbi:hypothetical protein EYZ11_010670 [Aspergillus tanneri]|uniref:Uncharacterized protein n=1 Tax=Aspergillus tanneri TaxID=1220188 RepID=A0A4S3J4S0_9EURO|nr:hypothetical protein EYZ11_010670 [Aspergillus tanneri]
MLDQNLSRGGLPVKRPNREQSIEDLEEVIVYFCKKYRTTSVIGIVITMYAEAVAIKPTVAMYQKNDYPKDIRDIGNARSIKVRS